MGTKAGASVDGEVRHLNVVARRVCHMKNQRLGNGVCGYKWLGSSGALAMRELASGQAGEGSRARPLEGPGAIERLLCGRGTRSS